MNEDKQTIRRLLEQNQRLRNVLDELYGMPEFDGSVKTSEMRQLIKQKTKELLNETSPI